MKLKKTIRKILFRLDVIPFALSNLWNNYLNAITANQRKEFKNIPIIVINFNQLESLKKLLDYLVIKKYKNIIIIDNCSSFPPLLEYYNAIEEDILIYRLKKNYGHKVFWERKDIFRSYMKGYHVITDPDVLPDPDCPDNFLMYFKKVLDRNNRVNKVGFSLRIGDIPDTNRFKKKILKWERKFWLHKTRDGNYRGTIDTTFALYGPPRLRFIKPGFYDAIRTGEPYIATHGGWYIDHDDLTEEQEYYLRLSSNSGSWNLDKDGLPLGKFY